MDRKEIAATLIGEAESAMNRDWPHAARLAADVRNRFPEYAAGFRIGGVSARVLKRFDEAAAILAQGATRFPTHAWPSAELAWTEMARGDIDEAARLAAELRVRFPDHPSGYRIGAASARQLRRLDEAAAIVADGAARFPTLAWPLVEKALLARAGGELDAAIGLCVELRDRFPKEPMGYRLGAQFLRARNRLADAEALLRDAADLFPELSWPAVEADAIARTRHNHAEATRVIASLRGASPASLADAGRRLETRGKVVVVLGMHRGGTSLCARILQGLGCDLGGPLMRPNFANEDGYQEHREIVECHDALFDAAGARWDTIRLVEPISREFVRGEQATVIRERLKGIVTAQVEAANGAWAFKDPRTARFLPLWKGILAELGIVPVWLLSVRDPRAVAASLSARDGLSPALGEWLWVEHYLDVLRHLGPEIAVVVHYERWFTDASRQLHDVAASIGGASDEAIDAARRSIRAELRHDHRFDSAPALNLSHIVYSWLSSDLSDLRRIQGEAEALWRGVEAFARRAPEP
jgi:tetratricopeptide (TPR) repeat protein